MPIETTRVLRRPTTSTPTVVTADICVLGSGIAGVSRPRSGQAGADRVVIVDAAPSLGGQAVGSIIGTIIGLYTHGPKPYQITHGIADELIEDLTEGRLADRRVSMTGTITFQYDEVRLARWIERKIEEAGIQALVGSVLTGVVVEGGACAGLELATRSAPCASRPRVCRCLRRRHRHLRSGLRRPRTGRARVRLAELPHRRLRHRRRQGSGRGGGARAAGRARRYGLVRHDGFLMHFPGKDRHAGQRHALRDAARPAGGCQMVFEGGARPTTSSGSCARSFPGSSRTRGSHLRQSRSPADALDRRHAAAHARRDSDPANGQPMRWRAVRGGWSCTMPRIWCTGSVSSRTTSTTFPLSCMVPKDADNIVAAGRCVDADVSALSAIRVMGPCIAMGAAAHALDRGSLGLTRSIRRRCSGCLIDRRRRSASSWLLWTRYD